MLWFCTAVVFALQVSMTIFVYSIHPLGCWEETAITGTESKLPYLVVGAIIATDRFDPL